MTTLPNQADSILRVFEIALLPVSGMVEIPCIRRHSDHQDEGAVGSSPIGRSLLASLELLQPHSRTVHPLSAELGQKCPLSGM